MPRPSYQLPSSSPDTGIEGMTAIMRSMNPTWTAKAGPSKIPQRAIAPAPAPASALDRAVSPAAIEDGESEDEISLARLVNRSGPAVVESEGSDESEDEVALSALARDAKSIAESERSRRMLAEQRDAPRRASLDAIRAKRKRRRLESSSPSPDTASTPPAVARTAAVPVLELSDDENTPDPTITALGGATEVSKENPVTTGGDVPEEDLSPDQVQSSGEKDLDGDADSDAGSDSTIHFATQPERARREEDHLETEHLGASPQSASDRVAGVDAKDEYDAEFDDWGFADFAFDAPDHSAPDLTPEPGSPQPASSSSRQPITPQVGVHLDNMFPDRVFPPKPPASGPSPVPVYVPPPKSSFPSHSRRMLLDALDADDVIGVVSNTRTARTEVSIGLSLDQPFHMISDLPVDIQEFYNNHWRRAGQKRRKKDDGPEGEEVTMQDLEAIAHKKDEAVAKAAREPKKARGGTGFWRGRGGRGRGRGRPRGSGRGRK